MFKHGKKVLVTVGALSALAFGGSTLANAASQPAKPASPPAIEQTSGPDLDKVQSGDQTTPDVAGASSRSASTSSSSAAEAPGVETAPGAETTGASEAPGSESATASDGPGGHADEPGNPNADTQFEGVQ